MSGFDGDPPTLTARETSPDEVLVLTSRPPGPAGLAVVTLLDGASSLAVDTAEPDTVLHLSLPDGPDGPDRSDDRTRRLVAAVLDPAAAAELARWSARPSPRTPLPLHPTAIDPRFARPSLGRLGLFARLAVGLDEVVRPDLTGAALAASLVDLGALALDLADLGPVPDGAELVIAGLDRWEDLDPDEWDDDDALLAATTRHSPQWRKSVYAHRPDLADRLEVLARDLRRDQQDRAVLATFPTLSDAPPPAASVGRAAARRGGAVGEPARAAAPRPLPVVDVLFDAELDGRLIAAERVGHHLTVHLGGLGPDDLWFRVFEAGTEPHPRLLALAPVGPSERTWRTAVALIGPDVADRDLRADVTRHPREPLRSTVVRRTERATHLGRVAARLSRTSAQGGSRPAAREAWLRCAGAWEDAGDLARARRALEYADTRPAPNWSDTTPLLTDLP